MKTIVYYEDVIGRYAIQQEDEVLTRIWVGDRLGSVSPDSVISETSLLKEAGRQLSAYFDGRLRKFDLPMSLRGTEFQMKVWKLLGDIPYGETITYGELARRLGDPAASRAVGMANSRNPLPILIPCHRVVGVGKKLVGYTGGLDIKMKLLQIECGYLG